ncbi:MAG: lytic transglycosylase domain-containing protein [Dermatophilaceae bacterium]|nr:lytic transglycosylase domain-containing protein [Dermatophilaceae bacterium]
MLLAAIGEVESSSLRGRRLDAAHDAVPPVRGPALTGGSYAAIRDSDGGRYDGDPVWDRAVGPMQFIPATWRIWGADGNGDGIRDPQNIEDAALAAANYLCAGGRDLSQEADLRAAVLSYNHSQRYLSTVVGIIQAVTSGALAGP